MPDIIATIDAATDGLCTCGCGAALDPGGPSGWWASERCQAQWQAGVDPEVVARRVAAARARSERRMARHLIHAGATTTYDPEQVAAAVRDVHRQAQACVDAVRPVFERLARYLAEVADQYRHLERAGIVAPQPPTDPMERALWLRRNRNTGPTERHRAPRRIDPTRAR